MKINRKSIIAIRGALVCALVSALFSACGGKKEQEKTVVVVGTDSLTMEDVRHIVPDAGNDPARIRQAVIRRVLGGLSAFDSAGIKLAERLSLLGDAEWSPEAASLLLNAGKELHSGISNARDMKAVFAFLDSLAARTNRAGSVAFLLSSSDSAALKGMKVSDKNFHTALFAAVFRIPGDMASTLLNFVKENRTARSKDAGSLIRGLVADPNAHGRARTVAAPDLVKQKAENPALALKFRPQNLIRDSIGVHLPYLKGFYNSQLKTDELAAGVVWAVFNVGADGKVIWARIKTSEIDSKPFLTRVENYLPGIRFSAIPDSVGAMTFEFPLEFKPEK
jgi:hypothetical protein